MNKTIKRKWVQAAVAVMCVLGMTCGFTSCEEELDPWEIVELEADCSQEEALPYDGGTFTVNVNANTAWTVITPEWMTVDKASGTGPGTVSVTVGENNGAERRYGTITITAGDDGPQGNVVGRKTSSVSISQTPFAEVIDPASTIKIDAVETDLLCQNNRTGLDQFDYVWVSGTVTWNVETQYTDDFIAAVFGDATMRITFMTDEDQTLGSEEFNIYGPSALYAGRHTHDLDPYDGHYIRFYNNRIPAKCMIEIYAYDKSGNVVNLFSSEKPYSIRFYDRYQ